MSKAQSLRSDSGYSPPMPTRPAVTDHLVYLQEHFLLQIQAMFVSLQRTFTQTVILSLTGLPLLLANLSYVSKVLILLIFTGGKQKKNPADDVFYVFTVWMKWLDGFGCRMPICDRRLHVQVVQYVHNVKFSFYEYWILYKCINYLLNGQMVLPWKKCRN